MVPETLRAIRRVVSYGAIGLIGGSPVWLPAVLTRGSFLGMGQALALPIGAAFLVGGFLHEVLLKSDRQASRTAESFGTEVVPYDEAGLAALWICEPVSPEFTIKPASRWSMGEDLTIGVRTVDDPLRLSGPEDVLIAGLDAEARQALLDTVELFDGEVAGGRVHVVLPAAADEQAVESVLKDLRIVAAALAIPPETVRERLADLVRTGPTARKGRALSALVQHHRSSIEAQQVAAEVMVGEDLDLARRAAVLMGRDDVVAEIDARVARVQGGLSLAKDGEGGEVSLAAGRAGQLSKVKG